MRKLPFRIKNKTMAALYVTVAAILLMAGFVEYRSYAENGQGNTEAVDVDSYEAICAITDGTGVSNASYRLTKDLLVGGTSETDLKTIKLNSTEAFSGTFDGGGHTITFQYVTIEVYSDTAAADVYQGLLFGEVTGTVENVFVEIGEGVSVVTKNTGNLTSSYDEGETASINQLQEEYKIKELTATIEQEAGSTERNLTLGDGLTVAEGEFQYYAVSANNVVTPGDALATCIKGHTNGVSIGNAEELKLMDGCMAQDGLVTKLGVHTCLEGKGHTIGGEVSYSIETDSVEDPNNPGGQIQIEKKVYNFDLPCGCTIDSLDITDLDSMKVTVRDKNTELVPHDYLYIPAATLIDYSKKVYIILDCGCIYHKENNQTYKFYSLGYGCKIHGLKKDEILENDTEYKLACGCYATYRGGGQFRVGLLAGNEYKCWENGHKHSSEATLKAEIKQLFDLQTEGGYSETTLLCGCKIGFDGRKLVYTEIPPTDPHEVGYSAVGETLSCGCTLHAKQTINIVGEKLSRTRTDTQEVDKTFYIGTIAGKVGSGGSICQVSVDGGTMQVTSQAHLDSQKVAEEASASIQATYEYLEDEKTQKIDYKDPTGLTVASNNDWNFAAPTDFLYAYSDVFVGGIAGCIEGGSVSEAQQKASVTVSLSTANPLDPTQNLGMTNTFIPELSNIRFAAGGIAGFTGGTTSKITDCYVEGSFIATRIENVNIDSRYAGGIVGYNVDTAATQVSDCILDVANTSAPSAGLLYGHMGGGTEEDCHYYEKVDYNNQYVQGAEIIKPIGSVSGGDALTKLPSAQWTRFAEKETGNSEADQRYQYRYVLSWLCYSVSSSDITFRAAEQQTIPNKDDTTSVTTNYEIELKDQPADTTVPEWGTIESLSIQYATHKNLNTLEEGYIEQKTPTEGEKARTFAFTLNTENAAYVKPGSVTLYDGKYYYMYQATGTEETLYPFGELTDFTITVGPERVNDEITVDQDYFEFSVKSGWKGTEEADYCLYALDVEKTSASMVSENLICYSGNLKKENVSGLVTLRDVFPFDQLERNIKGFWTVNSRIYPEMDYVGDHPLEHPDVPLTEATVKARKYQMEDNMNQWAEDILQTDKTTTVQARTTMELMVETGFDYYYRFDQSSTPPQGNVSAGEIWTAYDVDTFRVPADAQNGTLYLHVCKQTTGGTKNRIATYTLEVTSGVTITVTTKSDMGWIVNGEEISVEVTNLDNVITEVRCLWSLSDQRGLTTLKGQPGVQTIEADGDTIKGTVIADRNGSSSIQGYLYLQTAGILYNRDGGDAQAIAQALEEYIFIYRSQNNTLSLYPSTGVTEDSAAVLLSGTEFYFETNNDTSVSVLYTVSTTDPTTLEGEAELKYAADPVTEQEILDTLNVSSSLGVANYGDTYYVLRGTEWYEVISQSGSELRVYRDGDPNIVLENLTTDMQVYYITQVVCGGDLDPSNIQTSMYRVQAMGTVATPLPAIETKEDGSTKVPRGTRLYFNSATPEAEIYYAYGTTNAPLDSLFDDDALDANLQNGSIQLYDPNQGIQVKGEYETRFRIKMVAVYRRAITNADGSITYENLMQPSNPPVVYTYTVDDQDMAGDPTSTPTTTMASPATVLPGGKILLSSGTGGAEIIYTLDGSNPTVVWSESVDEDTYAIGNGTLYNPSEGIVMPEDGTGYFTIKAIAVKSGLSESNVSTLIFQYPNAVQVPFSTPIQGSVNLNTEVSLGCATEDALIYYEIATGDTIPADPTLSSAIFDGTQNFIILQKTTIKAFAVKDQVKSAVVTFEFTPTEKLGAPTASISSGSVVASGTTVSFQAAAGAVISYTTDGSDPLDTQNANVMTGTSTLIDGGEGELVTIKLCARATGRSPSDVVTYTYQISQYQGGVSSDTPSGSEVEANTTINLTTDIAGAVIYYTLDGSAPTTSSYQGSAVQLNAEPGTTVIVKAVAVTSGGSSTTASIFIYKIKALLAQPSVAPAGGVLSTALDVTVTAQTGQVYYTLDGTEPTANSELCTGTIHISRACTLKVIAITEAGDRSAVAEYVFRAAGKTASPAADRGSGILQAGETIYLSTATDGAQIYYSTDGTIPTVSNYSQLLTYTEEGITINRTVTIRAMAVMEGMQVSPVTEYSYTVENIPGAELKQQLEAEAAAKQLQNTDTSKLKARRETTSEIADQLSQEKQTVYTENFNRTVVAVSTDTLAEDTRLSTSKVKTGQSTIQEVEILKGTGFTVLESYEMTLYYGSVGKYEELEDGVLVALPIPVGYENASLTVAAVDDRSHVELLETTREGSMLYAKADSMGTFAIVGPKLLEEESDNFNWLYVLAGTAGCTALGGACYFISQKIKRVREKNYPNE